LENARDPPMKTFMRTYHAYVQSVSVSPRAAVQSSRFNLKGHRTLLEQTVSNISDLRQSSSSWK
jgi:hypothetical protein